MRRTIGRGLCILGLFLILWNLVGLVVYTHIENGDPRVFDERPRTLSERDFWDQAYRRPGEPLAPYLERLTGIVSDRMLRIDPADTKPTIFENWILWAYARHVGRHQWIDGGKAVRLGGGFCSQHAILFNGILRSQGIQSRILGLKGHVVNEVYLDGEWRVYDPDYDVVFGASLKALEAAPEKVYQAYRRAGRPEEESRNWEKVFASDVDNWHFRTAFMYAPRRAVVEAAARILIWALPAGCVMLGLTLGRCPSCSRRRRLASR